MWVEVGGRWEGRGKKSFCVCVVWCGAVRCCVRARLVWVTSDANEDQKERSTRVHQDRPCQTPAQQHSKHVAPPAALHLLVLAEQ